ncbi:S4 domain-containing protein [Nocardia grenadensis]|uniref:S4 domain-containing protein n=1 Tax=Nocardia grenadensis TaxID=931537 RepID=UPI003D911AC9
MDDDRFSVVLALVEGHHAATVEQATAWVMEGLVLVNGLPVRDPRRRVEAVDRVSIAGWHTAGV